MHCIYGDTYVSNCKVCFSVVGYYVSRQDANPGGTGEPDEAEGHSPLRLPS